MEQDRYTLAYRAAEARQVMGWIRAGHSGSLIGLRGAGKSNFLRFLLCEDVRQHYLGQNYADFVLILVDFLALTERTEWAVYELILDRLGGIEDDVVEEMASLHLDVVHSRDPLTARWTVERCVDILCRRPTRRVLLLFDEFDAVFRLLDSFLFRCLRALRDAHKGQVSYIVVTSDDLAFLRDDLGEVEHFHRLVSRNVCGLGPYSETDARQMIHYLASERFVELSTEDTANLIELSGGHAGLLKAAWGVLSNIRCGGDLEKLALVLGDEPAVQAECRKVWDNLSEDEQAALCDLVKERKIDPQTLQRLKLKGLVWENEARSRLFSPLFVKFISRQASPLEERVIIDRSLGVATIDGQRVELTELEFEMLCYLYERRGQVCTKDELIENVYRQQYDRAVGGIDDARLQTLISRLRAKVEPPRYIVTVRGEGYKFVEPVER